MPLENAKEGTPGFGRNIATEIKAGKPQKQAVAIAFSKARGDANYSESSDQLRRKIDELEERLTSTKDKTARTKIIMRIRDMESELGSRKDSTTLDKLLAEADGLYHRSDAMQSGTWGEQCEDSADVPYNHGGGKPGFSDKKIASNTDGSATYWQLSRGYGGRSTHHVIYTKDGRTIRAGTEASARKKLAEIANEGKSRSDATGCTFVLVDGSVDQVIQHQGNYKAIIEREVKDLKKMDAGRVTTKVFENEEQGYAKYDSVRGDAAPDVRKLKLDLKVVEMDLETSQKSKTDPDVWRTWERRRDRLRQKLSEAESRKDADTPKYNPEGVNQAIAAQNRSGRGKIGGREAKMIHSLLKGNEGYASRKDADPRSMTLAQAKAEYARRHKKIEDQLRRDLDKASRPNVRDFGTAFNNDMKVKAQARFTQAENDLAKELLWWRPEYGGRKDSEPTTLDALLSVADELYARSDEVARGDAHSPQPGDQVTIKKEAFERMRAGGYNGPRVVRVKEYRGSDLVLSNGQRVKPADVD